MLFQPVLNNVFIKLAKRVYFNHTLYNSCIKCIYGLYVNDTKLKIFSQIVPFTSDIYKQQFLYWMALIKSIPAKWTQLISTQRDTEIASDQCFYDTIILTNSKLENIHTLISSIRYK